jgi:glycosyltransferase involved in cell wall biosynthesis
LHSVAIQDCSDIEVIVIDDATPGGCHAAVHGFDSLRLRLIENESCVGPATSRNLGVRASQGKFIAFLDDDDEYLPNYLNHAIQLVNSTPNTDLLWSGVEISEKGTSDASTAIQLIYDTAQASRDDVFLQLFSIGIGFGVMVRRDTFLRLGGFDEQFSLVEDTEFFLRIIAADCQVTSLQGVHVRLHNHEGARMTSTANYELRLRECLTIREKYRTFLRTKPALAEQLDMHIDALSSFGAKAMTGFLAYPQISSGYQKLISAHL